MRSGNLKQSTIYKRDVWVTHRRKHSHLSQAGMCWVGYFWGHIVEVVHDNASNMTIPLGELGWESVPFIARALQLALNKGLNINQISHVGAACRKLVELFKHSSMAMTTLNEKQKQLHLEKHHLIQDVSTKWNSTYFMFESYNLSRLLQLYSVKLR